MPARPCARAALLLLPFAFAAVLLGLHLLARAVRAAVPFDCPRWWPFSVFDPRMPDVGALVAAVLTAGVAAVALPRLARRGYPVAAVAAVGLVLLLGSSLVQGIPYGFVHPVAGKGSGYGVQYYHDLHRAEDPHAFLRNFRAQQPEMFDHTRTHPPGALLWFRLLLALFGDRPAAFSLATAAAAVALTAAAYPTLLRAALPGLDARRRGYATLLLLLLPAVQVYYCATLDAVIAGLLLALFAAYVGEGREGTRLMVSAALLFAASFLTFGVLWALPVLFAADALRWRRSGRATTLVRLPAVLFAVGLGYLALYAAYGFDYLGALRTASRLENPDGFRGLVEPVSYLFTRLENVAELAAFAGPWVLLWLSRGRRPLREGAPLGWTLFAAATLTLGAMFLTGAYRTGETARACLFVWPFLLLPALAALMEADEADRKALLWLAVGQGLLMQLFGRWFW